MLARTTGTCAPHIAEELTRGLEKKQKTTLLLAEQLLIELLTSLFPVFSYKRDTQSVLSLSSHG